MNEDVSRFECGECKYFGKNCKCIDHNVVHFSRSCFSCDEYTYHHMICSAFEPIDEFASVKDEWEKLGGFYNWEPLYVEQWLNGKRPEYVSIIRSKVTDDKREPTDDRWHVPYDDFVKCNIMKDDGIHYISYHHIERSKKSVTGYKWVEEGEGILKV